METPLPTAPSRSSRFRHYWLISVMFVPVVIYALAASPQPAEEPGPTIPATTDDAPLPSPPDMEAVAHAEPLACMRQSLRLYREKVQGYRATFVRRESEDGRLEPRETILTAYREQPQSIFMNWVEGPSVGQRLVYVAGANDGKVLVKAKYVPWILPLDLNNARTRSLRNFGLRRATERLLDEVHQAGGDAHVYARHVGLEALSEIGGRMCHHLHFRFDAPRNKDVTDIDVYLDREHWLQVGTVLKDSKGSLVGEYFFRDVILNPDFGADPFTREALKE